MVHRAWLAWLEEPSGIPRGQLRIHGAFDLHRNVEWLRFGGRRRLGFRNLKIVGGDYRFLRLFQFRFLSRCRFGGRGYDFRGLHLLHLFAADFEKVPQIAIGGFELCENLEPFDAVTIPSLFEKLDRFSLALCNAICQTGFLQLGLALFRSLPHFLRESENGCISWSQFQPVVQNLKALLEILIRIALPGTLQERFYVGSFWRKRFLDRHMARLPQLLNVLEKCSQVLFRSQIEGAICIRLRIGRLQQARGSFEGQALLSRHAFVWPFSAVNQLPRHSAQTGVPMIDGI